MWLSFHKFLLVLYICRSPDCFRIGWPMRLDHDFFFVQSANKPDVNNALVVSPDKTKEKKKREKKDEEPEVLLCFS